MTSSSCRQYFLHPAAVHPPINRVGLLQPTPAAVSDACYVVTYLFDKIAAAKSTKLRPFTRGHVFTPVYSVVLQGACIRFKRDYQMCIGGRYYYKEMTVLKKTTKTLAAMTKSSSNLSKKYILSRCASPLFHQKRKKHTDVRGISCQYTVAREVPGNPLPSL